MRFRFPPLRRLAEPAVGHAPTNRRRWVRPPRLRAPMLARAGLDLPLREPPDLEPPDPDPPALEPPTAWRVPPPPVPPPLVPPRIGADPLTDPIELWQHPPRYWPDAGGTAIEDERMRPLYARALCLRHVEPGALLCFLFFEGTVVLGFLLALAELVSWWGVLMLPASVALMVKINDAVAAAVARSAARVPEIEQERFRRELQPAIGRAAVPAASRARAPEETAGVERRVRPGVPGGAAVSTMARVRPELAPTRARPRPLPTTAVPTEGIGDGRSGEAAPPPARRSRNTHPIERGRRAPTNPSDRDPPSGTEQWIRQSARERYGLE